MLKWMGIPESLGTERECNLLIREQQFVTTRARGIAVLKLEYMAGREGVAVEPDKSFIYSPVGVQEL